MVLGAAQVHGCFDGAVLPMSWRKRGPECCQHYAVLRVPSRGFVWCACRLCGHKWEEWPISGAVAY